MSILLRDLSLLSVTRITILLASSWSTIPSLFAITVEPLSLATVYSIPVPTSGAFGFIKGTACLIILDPIRALLASSFSKKGISEDATDTSCWGDTSIKSIDSESAVINSPFFLQLISSSKNLPFLSISAFACAIT